jgi:hypothetical protein
MNKKSENQKFVNIAKVGNFTKNAVENFEENIVTQKDYLEKTKVSDVPYLSDKYH